MGDGGERSGGGTGGPVRPGALTALLGELARAPEAAGWTLPVAPGETIGRFEIVGELGRGGFGAVYEARDTELGRSVAFKAVRAGSSDAVREQRALAEAEAAARLAHPNIVHLYDVGRCERGPYLIMELLRGETLDERLARGPPPLREAVRIAAEIARGVAHAHGQGVVHRDLKPGNVFVCEDGQVKVLDFGLAHVFGKGGVAGGTPAYMAPEQAAGESGDERSDVYALGVIVHELVAGKRPFEDGEAGPGERPSPPALSGAPAALARLVARMLARDPAARPASAVEAQAQLATIQKAMEPKRLLWAGVAVGAVALVGAGLFAWLWQRPLPEGRLLTVIADTDNRTGDPDLDGVSELLQSRLSDTRRLSLVGRSRIVNALRDGGGPLPRTLDAATVSPVAERASARLLLVPAVHRVDERYELSLRASDLQRREPLFALRAVALTKATLREAVERLAREARRHLREAPGDGPSDAEPAALPARADAWARFAEGQRRWSEARFPEARDAYLEALALDPSFAQALVSLVDLSVSGLAEVPGVAAHLRALRGSVQRLPPRERPYAEALLLFESPEEHGDPGVSEVVAACDRALEAWPEDPRPYVLAAVTILEDHADAAEARRYLEGVVALAPLQEHFAQNALAALGREEEALARARRWAAESPSWLAYVNLTAALRLSGDTEGALAAARRAVALGYDVGGPDFGSTPAMAFVEAGEADAWERLGGGRRFSWPVLRGRVREAEARRDAQGRPLGTPMRGTILAFARGDAGALVREGEVLYRAGLASFCAAWPAAVLGDLRSAAELAGRGATLVDRQNTCSRTYRLLRQWKLGDREAALRGFEGLVTGSARLYRGEILAELGRDREAVQELRRGRAKLGSIPAEFPVWAVSYPRTFYLEAVSLERLGEREEARKTLDRLLRLWDRADPDLPLLAEARALERRLAANGK